MIYVLIFIIIILICVIVYLLIYKKRPLIVRNYKEFTLDDISYKADIINNFYAIANNKIMRFQTDSLSLERNKDNGKYIIKDIEATCIEGKYEGDLFYFTDEDKIYITKNGLMSDL